MKSFLWCFCRKPECDFCGSYTVKEGRIMIPIFEHLYKKNILE